MNTLPFDPLELYAIDPLRNIRRRWRVVAARDLFGRWQVETSWSRIGAAGRTLVRSFAEEAEARRYVAALIGVRARALRRLGVPYLPAHGRKGGARGGGGGWGLVNLLLLEGAPMRILVTGGAGFIGSALVRHLIRETDHEVLNLDMLTYAGNLSTLAPIADSPRYRFVRAEICDRAAVDAAIAGFRPDVVTHLAAESHVDRSIDGPGTFIQTNLVGTYTILAAALDHWRGLEADARAAFRFHHISTDEVFGSLGATGRFDEDTPYDPRSPYSASKAGSDHLVSAWGHTYGLPVLVTNCSNNYGPYHFPEKMIPLMIVKALAGERLPVYGRGENVRDWLFVEDHVRALTAVFERGEPGRRYAIGGDAERRNIDVVRTLCAILDTLRPRGDGRSYAEQIGFVADRPGHDLRYAIDAARIRAELGWAPQESFETGLAATVRWYLDNEAWWRPLVAQEADTRRGLRPKSPTGN